MSLHSKLGASGMYRWEPCPGSVKLCEPLPAIESAAASEGSRVHTYAAKLLETSDLGNCGAKTPEEVSSVLLYLKTVKADIPRIEEYILLVEQELNLEKVFPGCFGTADAVLYIPHTRTLIVYDFKYGKGVHVEAENNSQLLYYALGAQLHLGRGIETFECVIVQPRCKSKSGAVRRWKVAKDEMLGFEIRLIEAARATLDIHAPLNAGRWCYFCPAKLICPEQKKMSDEKAAEAFGAI